ncbi:MAG TPA: carboxypeptidase regulatory-like domain-containing protein [Thermoanaerobaculia bacterium]|jgi:hypothetical protein|nr:carboxypeptidase regulatory-like domain-containing protein [Thermoanaerobaculia bacterium]
MLATRSSRCLLLLFIVALAAPFAIAQQTGEITGKVSAVDGSTLPGVTVEARSNVLPQPRVTTSGDTGDYRLPVLPPGTYTVTYTLAGLETVTRTVHVLLNGSATVNVALGVAGVSESITVTADSSLVDPDSTAIKSAISEDQIEELPVGQEYRDLIKLAPAVQYSEDAIRGPSAGGSGQDNVYLFDGVNVTLPLFGTLSAEPSTHDIEQISITKGGATAVDFIRSAGFSIDSVSKTGTNEYKGEVGFQFQNNFMRGDAEQIGRVPTDSNQDRTWLTANFGGPLLRDRLLFYASYYRPTVERTDRTNAYGALPNFDSSRDELFGKLTYTPTGTILLHGSYRASERTVENASIGITTPGTPSTALNEEATFNVGIFEGSWVINSRSFATAKYTNFVNDTSSLPNVLLDVVPSTAAGTRLDVNNLEQYGLITVPAIVAGQDAYNTFIGPLLQRYGYLDGGTRVGGGQVGVGLELNEQDFFRDSAQFGYDFTIGSKVSHDLHAGYLWSKDGEDLMRTSNGWGSITVPGGRPGSTFTPPGGTAQTVFYTAQFTRSLEGGVGGNNIHSEYVSHNLELNDTIRYNNWSFNAGFVISKDILYGQGLREADTLSGYVAAPGNKYKMYEIPWSKTLQPRLGATWAYNGLDNVYFSYARYVPAASSLPRAASWDRAILGLTTRVHFDATGTIIGSEQLASSSGKLFVEDLDPRHTDEYLIGTSQQFNSRWSGRAYGRYRFSTNFWEDTNNNARVLWGPDGTERALYINDLTARLAQIGSGSTYVIAELDGAFTKQYEATFESDWRGDRTFIRGSYTYAHYYGNFDQDNTSLDGNDSAIFLGSSNVADGPGRQIWDNKLGDLRGDRRHLLKVYGSYQLPWNGTIGGFGLYQSGQPWEAWNYEIYRFLPGFSGTSDLARYGEPAGRRRSPAHIQFDASYTQNVPVFGYNFQFVLDAFNLFDNETGYDLEPSVHRTTTNVRFAEPRNRFDPRRYQLAVRFEF